MQSTASQFGAPQRSTGNTFGDFLRYRLGRSVAVAAGGGAGKKPNYARSGCKNGAKLRQHRGGIDQIALCIHNLGMVGRFFGVAGKFHDYA